jgi:hypothetical protein
MCNSRPTAVKAMANSFRTFVTTLLVLIYMQGTSAAQALGRMECRHLSTMYLTVLRRPTTLRGGSGDPFWGRSYPWEAVGCKGPSDIPPYYEILGVNADAPLAEVRGPKTMFAVLAVASSE